MSIVDGNCGLFICGPRYERIVMFDAIEERDGFATGFLAGVDGATRFKPLNSYANFLIFYLPEDLDRAKEYSESILSVAEELAEFEDSGDDLVFPDGDEDDEDDEDDDDGVFDARLARCGALLDRCETLLDRPSSIPPYQAVPAADAAPVTAVKETNG